MVNLHKIYLDCGHTPEFTTHSPIAGEIITCPYCVKGALVVKGFPVNLKLRCDKCRYTHRVTGDDENEHLTRTHARMTATAHMLRHRGHTVTLYDHQHPLQTYRSDDPGEVPF